MNYCEHCGGKLDGGAYCPNCGAPINKAQDNKEVVSGNVVNNSVNVNTTTPTVKDNTTIAFVCSLLGVLCCNIIAIPGLILSIQSLNNMKEGKIGSEKRGLAIAGIVLSIIGLLVWGYNIINPGNNQEMVNKITEQFNLDYE